MTSLPARHLMQRHLGPLTLNAPAAAKVDAFLADRAAAADDEEPHAGQPQALRAMWALLRVLLRHQGRLHSVPGA